MPLRKSSFLRSIFSTIVFVLALFCLQNAQAISLEEMQKRYQIYKQNQTEGVLPFTLNSVETGRKQSVSIQTYLTDLPFQLFAERMSSAAVWCDFVPLHLNIKACSHFIDEDGTKLGFYIGVKSYSTPEEAQLLLLDFNAEQSENVLLLRFTAASGPFGSANYDFQIRAIDTGDGVYLEFDLSSEPGLVAGLAKIYLATVGRSKIGFSIVGKTWGGKPKFVRGSRAGSERNIVRYLLSIKAYFETFQYEPEDQRYTKRLERWFDLTEIYSRQLYEMPKSEYLSIKTKERKNQKILLDSIVRNITPVYQTRSSNL